VYDDHGNFAGYEIIAVDVTEQRTLKINSGMKHRATRRTCESRRLFEVLHARSAGPSAQVEFSLLLLDLDGLKRINDQFDMWLGAGHLQARTDRSRLLQVGDRARHGGDEFALVLGTGIGCRHLVGQRICDLLAKDAEEPALSVGVGAAAYPGNAETIGTLLYAADRTLT
jgi:diguanylate cyclase (GGDEF)-like protein